jgi:uncharacterized membrane protein
MLHAVKRITGRNLWANLRTCSSGSPHPFVTRWMGENNYAPPPVALYGIALLTSPRRKFFGIKSHRIGRDNCKAIMCP